VCVCGVSMHVCVCNVCVSLCSVCVCVCVGVSVFVYVSLWVESSVCAKGQCKRDIFF
jgi:hypothetical protein